jgi:hypothetical protein
MYRLFPPELIAFILAGGSPTSAQIDAVAGHIVSDLAVAGAGSAMSASHLTGMAHDLARVALMGARDPGASPGNGSQLTSLEPFWITG